MLLLVLPVQMLRFNSLDLTNFARCTYSTCIPSYKQVTYLKCDQLLLIFPTIVKRMSAWGRSNVMIVYFVLYFIFWKMGFWEVRTVFSETRNGAIFATILSKQLTLQDQLKTVAFFKKFGCLRRIPLVLFIRFTLKTLQWHYFHRMVR